MSKLKFSGRYLSLFMAKDSELLLYGIDLLHSSSRRADDREIMFALSVKSSEANSDQLGILLAITLPY